MLQEKSAGGLAMVARRQDEISGRFEATSKATRVSLLLRAIVATHVGSGNVKTYRKAS
jgi:hypothetical protein